MPPVTDAAIVLRQWDYSETSQTVSLFGRELGVVRGLAKGSRRPKTPYSGGLEPLTLGQAVLIPRSSSELHLVTEWDLQEIFWGPRRRLRAHYAGLYLVDLVHHLLSANDPHPALFDALAAGLRRLDAPDAWAPAVARFAWALLVEAGYRPDLDEPDAAAPGGRALGFDPAAGRLIADPGEARRDVWRVRRSTIGLLRGIDGGEAGAAADDDAAGAERAARLLSFYLRHIMGRELRSREMLFDPQAR